MPELPEVETLRRGLEQSVLGARIKEVQCYRRKLRYPLAENFELCLRGRRFDCILRRGKYLRLCLDTKASLIVHLGMSGTMRLQAAQLERQRHDHVVFRLLCRDKQVRLLVYHDPRRFGFLRYAGQEEEDPLAKLGVDACDPALDARRLGGILAKRKMPVKAALMDQRLVAGLGNIYVCEMLFAARISPWLPACSLTAGQIETLLVAMRRTLNAAISAGGSSLRDFHALEGERGYFPLDFCVYGRAGEQCPACPASISRAVQSARATFFCPDCQR